MELGKSNAIVTNTLGNREMIESVMITSGHHADLRITPSMTFATSSHLSTAVSMTS